MDLVCGGLVGVGLGQLGLAVAGVVSGSDSAGHAVEMAGSSMAHFSHESAAWNLALGVAFVWVALQRSRPATGLVPTIAAFVGVLTALSVPDLLAGRVEAGRLAGHALVVLGLILLMTHRILTRGGGDAPAEPGYPHRHRHALGEPSAPPRDDDVAPEGGAGGGLKPTGRRRAA
jgi:predicted anti-sigma-YlaC factor YlaD